jgi:hypothetical protein
VLTWLSPERKRKREKEKRKSTQERDGDLPLSRHKRKGKRDRERERGYTLDSCWPLLSKDDVSVCVCVVSPLRGPRTSEHTFTTNTYTSCTSRGSGWRMLCGVEVTELSTYASSY